MKPIIYVQQRTGSPREVKYLIENKIDYDVVAVDPSDKTTIRALVNEIRQSRFPGAFTNLKTLPIISYNGKTWPNRKIHLATDYIVKKEAEQRKNCQIKKIEIDENKIDTVVRNLIIGGNKEIEKYFNELTSHEQETFAIAARLQKHGSAHLLDDFKDMVSNWLEHKITQLDPYMREEPQKETHTYLWWIE